MLPPLKGARMPTLISFASFASQVVSDAIVGAASGLSAASASPQPRSGTAAAIASIVDRIVWMCLAASSFMAGLQLSSVIGCGVARCIGADAQNGESERLGARHDRVDFDIFVGRVSAAAHRAESAEGRRALLGGKAGIGAASR